MIEIWEWPKNWGLSWERSTNYWRRGIGAFWWCMNHFWSWNFFGIILDWVEALGSNFCLKIHYPFKDPKTPPTCQVSEILPDPYKWDTNTILDEGGDPMPPYPLKIYTWQVFNGKLGACQFAMSVWATE